MLRKTEYVLKNLGNEHILVPTGGEVTNLNGILVLNDTALFIWKMLENEITEKHSFPTRRSSDLRKSVV